MESRKDSEPEQLDEEFSGLAADDFDLESDNNGVFEGMNYDVLNSNTKSRKCSISSMVYHTKNKRSGKRRSTFSLNEIVIIQKSIKQHLFRKKLKRSKELLLALYQGWKLRKILKETDVLNSLMNIQDINAYLEELDGVDDSETIQQAKEERKQLIEGFIDMLDKQLNFKPEEPSNNNKRMSIQLLIKQVDQVVRI
jgi:hypothetical protein